MRVRVQDMRQRQAHRWYTIRSWSSPPNKEDRSTGLPLRYKRSHARTLSLAAHDPARKSTHNVKQSVDITGITTPVSYLVSVSV